MLGAVEIPCFKINTDKDGKFKSIEYTDMVLEEDIIAPVVEKVFENKYGIKMKIEGNDKYNKTFNSFLKESKYTNEGEIYYIDEKFMAGVISIIKEPSDYTVDSRIPKRVRQYKTVTFGIQ